MYTLEVKPGADGEVLWLDRSQYKILKRSTNTTLLLSSDGKQCFAILNGGHRRRVLTRLGYDPDQTYNPPAINGGTF